MRQLHHFRIFTCMAIISGLMLLVVPGNVYADLNGITLKGAFNGQEVTKTDAHTDDPIEGVTLKIDEPFTLDFYVTPVKDGKVNVHLAEPGEETLASYYRISGDELTDSSGLSVEKNCTAGETVHYHWVLAPNDNWANGNCPISIIYSVAQREDKKVINGNWGFVNPYISSEHYDGVKPTSSTGSNDNNTTGATTPGFSILPAVAAFFAALVVVGLYRRK